MNDTIAVARMGRSTNLEPDRGLDSSPRSLNIGIGLRVVLAAIALLAVVAVLALASVTAQSPDGVIALGTDSSLAPSVDSAWQTTRDVQAAVTAQGLATSPSSGALQPPSVEGDGTLQLGPAGSVDRIDISLPLTAPGRDAGASSVFKGRAVDTKVIVQAAGPETRTFVQLASRDAPVRHEFRFGGAARKLELGRDGGIMVRDSRNRTLGMVAPAWARDARGREVPTKYEVNGLLLTQVVSHQDRALAYPITADPAVRHWWGFGFRFSHAVSRKLLRYALAGAGGAAGAAVCATLGVTANPLLIAACGGVAAAILSDLSDAAVKRALAGNKCIEGGRRWFPVPDFYARIVGCK